jgi:hypothetical protein
MLVAVLTALTIAAGQSTSVARPLGHVRSSDPLVLRLIRDGRRLSPTFDGLVRQLDASDLVVYVRVRHDGPLTSLRFVGASSQQRYVEIALALQAGQANLTAVLAHEFQHALEVAGSPDVRNRDAFVALYERIGIERTTVRGRNLETEGARRRQSQVFQELTRRVKGGRDTLLAEAREGLAVSPGPDARVKDR